MRARAALSGRISACLEQARRPSASSPALANCSGRESHEEVMTDFPHPTANAEIEDKGSLPVELAAQVVRLLDVGMQMEVPGWGRYPIRTLGVSRIIDRYHDTPDRVFQTWSYEARSILTFYVLRQICARPAIWFVSNIPSPFL